jgi:hypothetical protein
MPNIVRIHNILKFALAVASQNDDWRSRELGPIHLIKYLYLADLAFAREHEGKTYTGLSWRFHKFGPWCEEAFNELDPALSSINAEKKNISSKYEDDFTRWKNMDPYLADDLEKNLEVTVSLRIKWAVQKFGPDTEDLLHYVYDTKPILNACPGNFLDFTLAIETSDEIIDAPKKTKQLSEGQQKRQRRRISKVREELKKRFESQKKELIREQSASQQPTPRYDDIYWEGVECLDLIAGNDIQKDSFTATISPQMWKSKARYDPEIS